MYKGQFRQILNSSESRKYYMLLFHSALFGIKKLLKKQLCLYLKVKSKCEKNSSEATLYIRIII